MPRSIAVLQAMLLSYKRQNRPGPSQGGSASPNLLTFVDRPSGTNSCGMCVKFTTKVQIHNTHQTMVGARKTEARTCLVSLSFTCENAPVILQPKQGILDTTSFAISLLVETEWQLPTGLVWKDWAVAPLLEKRSPEQPISTCHNSNLPGYVNSMCAEVIV
jgi:hypothetical protein